jgi:hypothetical protein
MFQGDTWIFAAPDSAVTDIDLTVDMKCALITENYGVQKPLIILYPMKSHGTITIPDKTWCVLLHYNSSKHCTCPLNKFI